MAAHIRYLLMHCSVLYCWSVHFGGAALQSSPYSCITELLSVCCSSAATPICGCLVFAVCIRTLLDAVCLDAYSIPRHNYSMLSGWPFCHLGLVTVCFHASGSSFDLCVLAKPMPAEHNNDAMQDNVLPAM